MNALHIRVCVSLQDGLWLVAKEPSVIQGYQRGILTPNFMEFTRLYEAMVSFECSNILYVLLYVISKALFTCGIEIHLIVSDFTDTLLGIVCSSNVSHMLTCDQVT